MCSTLIQQKRGGGNGHRDGVRDDSQGGDMAGVVSKDKCKISAKRGAIAGVKNRDGVREDSQRKNHGRSGCRGRPKRQASQDSEESAQVYAYMMYEYSCCY